MKELSQSPRGSRLSGAGLKPTPRATLAQSSRNVGLNRLRLRVLCFSAYLGKEAGFDSEIFKSKEAGGGPSLQGERVWDFSSGCPQPPFKI